MSRSFFSSSDLTPHISHACQQHGTCSGMSQEAYFKKTLALYQLYRNGCDPKHNNCNYCFSSEFSFEDERQCWYSYKCFLLPPKQWWQASHENDKQTIWVHRNVTQAYTQAYRYQYIRYQRNLLNYCTHILFNRFTPKTQLDSKISSKYYTEQY